MSKRIDDYRILSGRNFAEIEEFVKSFINSNDGYELCGGVSVVLEEAGTPGIDRYIKPCYYQAVVKYQN